MLPVTLTSKTKFKTCQKNITSKVTIYLIILSICTAPHLTIRFIVFWPIINKT